CYLLNTYLGPPAERQLLAACVRGELVVEPVEATDLQRALQLLETYAEANIGFVDAAVVAVAERLRIPRVLTTDRRHFALVRPRHCAALELLP
ncbi:MAG: VapC toxin family PIN domain ribonuclease, partial [Chloroflexi bacterium]|nr:VapC toxin family PIN domain ribonuclease [Chloroflexota bacterium]